MSCLTPHAIKSALDSGEVRKLKHGGFKGLYLYVKNGRGFWLHQFYEFGPTKNNPAPHWHTRTKSLGPLTALTPAAAVRALKSFDVARHDGDTGKPLVVARVSNIAGDSFGAALATYLTNHPEIPGSTQSLAEKYIPAGFRAKAATAITAEDVADVLKGNDQDGEPLWTGPGPNRGNRFRLLMEHVFAAKAINPNPAQWKGGALPHCFSKDETKRTAIVNRPSMPFADVPSFMAELAERIKVKPLSETIEDRAGRFVILTAVRRKEALSATWAEFDFANRVWTIPAARMKMKRPHRVPLTDAMVACLGKSGDADAFVFQNATGGPLSNSHAALDKEWVPNGYTLHGFRSSFRTWAAEQDHGRKYPFEVREAALAHGKADPNTGKVDKVAGAYDRSELFEARQDMMAAWSEFCTTTR